MADVGEAIVTATVTTPFGSFVGFMVNPTFSLDYSGFQRESINVGGPLFKATSDIEPVCCFSLRVGRQIQRSSISAPCIVHCCLDERFSHSVSPS